MPNDFGLKIWESNINPFFKRYKLVFFSLTAFLIFFPVLFFPINVLTDMLWVSFFYSFIYIVFLPFIILFLILGLAFSKKHLKVYERGIKIRVNPFSKKKILFNQINKIEVETIDPIVYKNKFSKFLLYDPDSLTAIRKTGDFSIISIKTNEGKKFKIRNSFISGVEDAKNIISREVSKQKELELKKTPKKTIVKKSIKKEKEKPKIQKDKSKEIKPEVGERFCKFCGRELIEAKTYCTQCGKKLSERDKINYCKYCGRAVSGSGEFCVKCGKKIS